MPKIRVLFWTLRYLRPSQIIGRIFYKFYTPSIDLTKIPSISKLPDNWVKPARRKTSMVSPTEFILLNERKTFPLSQGWTDSTVSKLWIYNLHYFDDLNARDAERRKHWHRDLLCKWVKDNPPVKGVGWDPYPTSLRIVNWIKWALSGNTLDEQCVKSLATQSRWLVKRLEYHLLGNHLFVNAKALVFAGLYFEGEEAERWLKTGMKILQTEIPEQILSDGGQFERSTMYHALALEDILDLVNIVTAYPERIAPKYLAVVDLIKKQVNQMRHWLMSMSHPDGRIAFFNDAAYGVAPETEELESYARRLGFDDKNIPEKRITNLRDSGYINIHVSELNLLIDVARIGPDYLPAHAHADTLSYEMSLFGQRVLVNSGTSKYGVDHERLKQRATASHNTVTVDGNDSSEIWSGFRVARRAYPSECLVEESSAAIHIIYEHNGYMRLPGKCIHRRDWLVKDRSLLITDSIRGAFKEACSYMYFHPDVMIRDTNENAQFSITLTSGQEVLIKIENASSCELNDSNWHPEFGLSVKNKCIVAKFSASEIKTRMAW